MFWRRAIAARADPSDFRVGSGLGERPAPGGGKGTLTVKDNRTGNTYEIQVRVRDAQPARQNSPGTDPRTSSARASTTLAVAFRL